MAVAYSTVSCVFLVTLFANIKILEHAGVNAFIIVRSCTPFAVRAPTPLHSFLTPSAVHTSPPPTHGSSVVTQGSTRLHWETARVRLVSAYSQLTAKGKWA